MSVPFKIDLQGKVAVVTGAGGVLCSTMAEALAECGAKVALLDLNGEAAKQSADKITAAGGIAKGYQANALEKDSLETAHIKILDDFGPCDILINGAGGNHPLATTDKEYFSAGDLEEDVKTFFDLDQNLLAVWRRLLRALAKIDCYFLQVIIVQALQKIIIV